MSELLDIFVHKKDFDLFTRNDLVLKIKDNALCVKIYEDSISGKTSCSMTNNELAKFWEDKLRLSNWDIRYIFDCHRKDFVVEGRTGECATNYMMHSAIIKIADETELLDDEREGFDFEQVLVHELLHVNFDLLYRDRAKKDERFDSYLSDEITHHVLNTVACALVKARRQE